MATHLYTPDTLPAHLQERVAGAFINTLDLDAVIYEDAHTIKEHLQSIIDVSNIRYDLSYSQGAGASFSGSLSLADIIAGIPALQRDYPHIYTEFKTQLGAFKHLHAQIKLEDLPDPGVIVSTNPSNYCHSGTMRFTCLAGGYHTEEEFYYRLKALPPEDQPDDLEAEADRMAEEFEDTYCEPLKDFAVDVADYIYTHLRELADCYQSWDYVQEYLRDNGLCVYYDAQEDTFKVCTCDSH